jgi:VPDSG-CTERM motif
MTAWLANSALAAPQYGTFGPLPALTAGGSINQSVAISTAPGLTIGLTAQQRYFNPLVTNNGAGTFFAGTGQNNGGPGSSSAFQGSLWNFDFFIGGTNIAGYTFTLSYGLVGAQIYSFNPLLDLDAPVGGTFQDSQNLLFSNFGGAPNAFAGLFDPNANADYEFTLTARNLAGGIAATSDIIVHVGSGSAVPDTGSTLLMLTGALAGLTLLRRRMLA